MSEGLVTIGAVEAARAMRDGRMTSREYVEACLARIEAYEETVQAWQFLDPAHALRQADACDEDHRRGRPHGPLHGIPVGIKDIFDTADMPTEDGSPLHAGRLPRRDAAAVERLRAAGAVILGKTVTTEFANMNPSRTRNPHNLAHTPGGSSSGSAASVAAYMVPLAIGSQTNGSVIRPASFCGVVGFKPTFGLIPRTGMFRLSRTLDTVGVFARSIDDAALIAECLIGFDAGDEDTHPRATPPLLETALAEPPLPPKFAFVKTPVWDKAEAEIQAGFAELVSLLGEAANEVELPSIFARAHYWQRAIADADIAVNLAEEYERGRDQMSPTIRGTIERGARVGAFDYIQSLAARKLLNDALTELFFECDAILTPAAPGAAPARLDTTGDPSFCTIWTLCGLPTITLPLLRDGAGMPIGVQLVGAPGNDARLLRTARWLAARIAG